MKQKILRGQIYHINSDPENDPVGAEIWSDRPALIVSSDANNATNDCVEIVYCTLSFKKRVSPVHVKVTSGDKFAIAMCEQVHSVDKSRLADYIGSITPEQQKNIDAALAISLEIVPSSHPIGLFKKWENYIKRYHLDIVNEQKLLKEKLQADDRSQKLIEQLMKERDSYKALYEAKSKLLNEINVLSK